MSGNEQNSPGAADLKPDSRTDAEILDSILAKSTELDQLRRRQAVISVIGIVAIIAVLILFFLNIVSFGKSINQKELADKTVKKAMELSSDTDVIAMQKDFNKIFLPALRKEFRNKLKDAVPEVRETLIQENNAVLSYMENDIRMRVVNHLHDSFSAIEKKLVAKYEKDVPETEDLAQALAETEKELLSNTETKLNGKLEKATDSLRKLDQSCQDMKKLPEYAVISRMPQEDVERQLLESFLELWIYHLNPARGDLPAAINGGF